MSDCGFGVSPVNYPDPDPEVSNNSTQNTQILFVDVLKGRGRGGWLRYGPNHLYI